MIQQLLQLAFFGSFAWFCVVSAVLLICFILSETVEHGGIAFVAVLDYLILNHFFGNIPTKEIFTWWNIAVYLFIGVVYALIRTYFFGREESKAQSKLGPISESWILDELKENVFRWWFLWPISLIVWMFSKIFGQLWDKLYDACSSLFLYIFKLGLKTNKNTIKD